MVEWRMDWHGLNPQFELVPILFSSVPPSLIWSEEEEELWSIPYSCCSDPLINSGHNAKFSGTCVNNNLDNMRSGGGTREQSTFLLLYLYYLLTNNHNKNNLFDCRVCFIQSSTDSNPPNRDFIINSACLWSPPGSCLAELDLFFDSPFEKVLAYVDKHIILIIHRSIDQSAGREGR